MSINVTDNGTTYTDISQVALKNGIGDLLKSLVLTEDRSGATGEFKKIGEYTNTTASTWYVYNLFSTVNGYPAITVSYDYGCFLVKGDCDPETESGMTNTLVVYTPERVWFAMIGSRINYGSQHGTFMAERSVTGKNNVLFSDAPSSYIGGGSNSFANGIAKNKTAEVYECELPEIPAKLFEYGYTVETP